MEQTQRQKWKPQHKVNATPTDHEQPKPKSDNPKSKPDKKRGTDHTVNALINSGSSQLQPLHWARMAWTTTNVNDSPQQYSELSEWLINSGCSNHMTPFTEDLITDVSKSKSLVEVANGTIVKAPKKGTSLL